MRQLIFVALFVLLATCYATEGTPLEVATTQEAKNILAKKEATVQETKTQNTIHDGETTTLSTLHDAGVLNKEAKTLETPKSDAATVQTTLHDSDVLEKTENAKPATADFNGGNAATGTYGTSVVLDNDYSLSNKNGATVNELLEEGKIESFPHESLEEHENIQENVEVAQNEETLDSKVTEDYEHALGAAINSAKFLDVDQPEVLEEMDTLEDATQEDMKMLEKNDEDVLEDEKEAVVEDKEA